MTSYVDIDDDIEYDFDAKKLIDTLSERVLDLEGCPYECSINVTVTHSDEVQTYNRDYRGIDNTTDVLSFPALDITDGHFEDIDEEDSGLFDPEDGTLILGDIMINADRVSSQAEEYGHSIRREFAFLIAHSLFHLCGYDHIDDKSARIMEDKQEQILTELGITRD